ncbi:DUF1566 domain-containing protein [Dysgonomonas sp. GY75]|uniref:DUF1566 domain-containing protein n=1 Tax=Dysgonomonas sp. GY75 TaxID=2780419 RepID=UPI00188414AA|nr:DUF1566 domain-containing protein [Dysgonomonas sp. GY75]MBF0651961.1 DUF1566 domain-containing protein [Dysgonomonas sp. GY75]
MKTKTKLLSCLLLVLCYLPMQGQVTIGDGIAPQDFSVLEVSTLSTKGGLRLPQLTTDQRDNVLMKSAHWTSEVLGKGRGLTIYNTDTDCVEYWNKTKWISLCSGNAGFEGGDCADTPVPPAGGSTNCGITDPNCDTEGEYTFTFVTGSDYATLEVTDAGAGEFKLTFDANDRASDRQAIVMVTSPCGTSSMFAFTQKGDDTGCGTTAVPAIKSVGDITAMCGNGAAYLYLEGYPATGIFIWTLNGQQVGTGHNYTAYTSGKYIVYGDKIGCTNKSEFQLTLSGMGAPAPVADVVRGNNGLVCDAAGTTKLIAQKPAGSGTVRWFKDGVLQNLTTPDNEVDAGVGEWFAVVNEGACWSEPSETITVSVDPNTGADLIKPIVSYTGGFCAGGSELLKVTNPQAGYTYTWYENNTQLSPTGTQYLYNVPADAASVVIRCRATMAGGCANEAIETKIINTGTIPGRPSITGDRILCSGVATLYANAAATGTTYAYNWYKDGVPYANTESITVTEGATYSLTVTSDGGTGCTSPAATRTIDNASSAKPTVTLNRSTETPNQGDVVTYMASINFGPATGYTWTYSNATLQSGGTTSSANAVFKFGNPGPAWVKVEVENACDIGTATHSVADVQPNCISPDGVFPDLSTNILPLETVAGIGVTLGRVSATFPSLSGDPTVWYQWWKNTVNSNTGGTIVKDWSTSHSYVATESSDGTYFYYCKVKNACGTDASALASGVYTVKVLPNPETLPEGTGTLVGKTCFDVVEINNGGSCGELAGRLSQKADFLQAATNTQTYTFTTSGTVSKIRFIYTNAGEEVIESITPGNASWATGTSLSGTYTVTVKYKTDLTSKASGLTREQALKAALYVVYNDNPTGTGTEKMLKLDISVQDCTCCPGYLAVGGEYTKTYTGTYLSALNHGDNISSVLTYFTATGKSVCFFKTDALAGTGVAFTNAYNKCADGSYVDAEFRSMGSWRLPNLAEIGALQSVHSSLATNPNSMLGTANMQTANYWTQTQRSANDGWTWGFSAGKALYEAKGESYTVRCVRTL